MIRFGWYNPGTIIYTMSDYIVLILLQTKVKALSKSGNKE